MVFEGDRVHLSNPTNLQDFNIISSSSSPQGGVEEGYISITFFKPLDPGILMDEALFVHEGFDSF